MSKITVDRKVLEQALEALERADCDNYEPQHDSAINALRAELDQPVQEPVAREWQSLSEDEIYYIWDGIPSRHQVQMIRDIEDALKEMNT